MDTFFCKLAAAVRLNYGSGRKVVSARLRNSGTQAMNFIEISILVVLHGFPLTRGSDLAALSTSTAIHTDVRSSYRPRLLMRLYEMEACAASRQESSHVSCSGPWTVLGLDAC
jgi:hypothetical protein